MSYTFYDAVFDIAKALTYVYQGTSTGGSTTTVVDTGGEEPEAFFDNGVVWIPAHTSDATAIAASVQKVTGHSANTITFTPAHSKAVISGLDYYVSKPDFPLWALRSALNTTLQEISPIIATKRVTTDGAQEYGTTDDTVIGKHIIKIEIATSTTPDYAWKLHYNWHQTYEYDATGVNKADRLLIFDTDHIPDSGYLMQVTYQEWHPNVSAAADIIWDEIDHEWLKWRSAANALRTRLQEVKNDDPQIAVMLNEALTNAAARANLHPRHDGIIRHARW